MKDKIDKIFQNIINYCVIKKKIKTYKFFYYLFKNFILGPFIINFKYYKFYSYSQKKSLSRWMLKNLKPWDLNNIQLIYNLLGNDKSLFIDCGANYGAYSIPISKKKPKTTIVCFDPSKKALIELRNNIQLNKSKKIKYYNYGISDKISNSFFNDNIDNFKNSGEYSFNKLKSSYKVKTITLDNFLKDFNIKIYKKIIIKLDVEGYEFKALLGMKNLLLNNNVIIFFELSRMLLREKSFNFKKFKKFLNFYKLCIIDLNLNLINIEDILNKFFHLEVRKNTIGDYILVKNSFYKKNIRMSNYVN